MNTAFNQFALTLPQGKSPAASLQAYIDWVHQVPMLSEQDEISLAEKLRANEDLTAARELILSHLRFVVRIARGFNGYGLSQADLIQEGNIGLMKAVKRFDPSHGVRLASFAVHWIKAEMHEFIIRNWRMVKIATTKAQRKLFFKMRSLGNRLGWNTDADVRYVAETLDVSESEVRHMEMRMNAPDTAFDAPVGLEDSNHYAPEDYLASGQQHEPAWQAMQQDSMNWESQQLQNGMQQLDERSQTIINKRWLQTPKATLHELAAELKVSAERVRQLEAQAMKKIKQAILQTSDA